MIIQNIASLLPLKSFVQWTGDRRGAFIFLNDPQACQFYHQRKVVLNLTVFVGAEEEIASHWSSN